MTNLIGRVAARAWSTAPRDLVGQIGRKLKGGPATPLEHFAATPNARDWIRHWTNFTRNETAAQHRLDRWQPFDFADRSFLEIGCGLTAGLAPIALFLGARSAYGIEPQWQDGLIDEAPVRESYYRPFWTFLCSVYGQRMPFDRFYERRHTDLTIHAGPLDTARIARPADLVWSLSCLEHIGDLAGSISHLAGHCSGDCRQIHIVDFGNHQSKVTPFANLYDRQPDRIDSGLRAHINRLRHPDIVRLFRDHDFAVRHLTIARQPVDGMVIAPYWRDTYDSEDLAVRSAAYFVARD